MKNTRSALGGASENPEDCISDFDSFERSLESKLDGPRSDHSFGDQQAHINGLLSQLDDEPTHAADQSQALTPEPGHSVSALIAANKLKRKRRKSAIRSQNYRDRERRERTIDVDKVIEQLDAIPRPPFDRTLRKIYNTRLAALVAATHAPNARQSLVQIRDEEERITTAWQAKASFGGTKTSLAEIAKRYPGKITKWQIRNLLDKVRKLEQPGGPWHGLG
ncbi:hypothetical protein [Bradyrhizobium sp. CCBAU 53338]|uniref:hypothetical protein n=1 Tax=Bradyrhizobium sp. CCBAU 53338 TaxID=1325111 RepID=UPI00188D4406|nr:hypothetical protein [Bradyrhizobium sp. CCBAU 53338]QOZ55878.1 hypothetical protein XH90_34245 [Bradyrhizobium sp. CCBAU 53338]